MATPLKDRGDPASELFEVENYPFYRLNRTASRYNRLIEAELRKIDLEVLAWRVLLILGETSPLPAAKVAELCFINLSTLTRLIERMKRAGLVLTFTSESDRRVTQIGMTDAGLAKLKEARVITAPFYQQAIKGFSERELSSLLRLLDQLHDNLEEPAVQGMPRKTKLTSPA
ncbi:MarR family winged helix-turn-helix transcriptional regulator [Aurantiacibacter rhizosphaerae]|uniref:MarR family transcriptional regulator n=1 Tax=Aurantiacibacter rhizosphaerae TaxID=2691582 RepID=A0A844XC80_9SPHN|nr:MarR family transcriptional regulator [Aurantiacibacter rhizosphaerae]MWV27115.1 MarR family transcriptional regulator [Aurantiacibacter rhizosphaerae]